MKVIRKKVCLVGSDGVGKTSLILRYTRNTFSDSYLATLGCDFYEMTFQREGGELQLYTWDIASQANFEKMRGYYLSHSHLGVICVDINRTEPEFIEPWIENIKKYSGVDTPLLLALNKIDLAEKPDEIQSIQEDLKKRYKSEVVIVSAKTGKNVHTLFEMTADILYDSHKVN